MKQNPEQKRRDGHIEVKLYASRWTGETLIPWLELSGTPEVVAERLRWLAGHPYLKPPKKGRRTPYNSKRTA